jgi:hypothetical protein
LLWTETLVSDSTAKWFNQWLGTLLHLISLLLPGIRSPWHSQAIKARASAIAKLKMDPNEDREIAQETKLQSRWSLGDSLLSVDAKVYSYLSPLRDAKVPDDLKKIKDTHYQKYQSILHCDKEQLRNGLRPTLDAINILCRQYGIPTAHGRKTERCRDGATSLASDPYDTEEEEWFEKKVERWQRAASDHSDISDTDDDAHGNTIKDDKQSVSSPTTTASSATSTSSGMDLKSAKEKKMQERNDDRDKRRKKSTAPVPVEEYPLQITMADVRDALYLIMGHSELMKHAISEGTKAVNKVTSSAGDDINQIMFEYMRRQPYGGRRYPGDVPRISILAGLTVY